MGDVITEAAEDGDSVGGVVSCMATGLPIGFGGIWFDALDVSLARMMFSIPMRSLPFPPSRVWSSATDSASRP